MYENSKPVQKSDILLSLHFFNICIFVYSLLLRSPRALSKKFRPRAFAASAHGWTEYDVLLNDADLAFDGIIGITRVVDGVERMSSVFR